MTPSIDMLAIAGGEISCPKPTQRMTRKAKSKRNRLSQEETLKEVVTQHQVGSSEVVYIGMCQHVKGDHEFERVLEGAGSMGRV